MVVQRDVAQSQDRFRRIVESLCKRKVEPPGNGRLSRRERCGSDGQMVSKQLPGAGPVGRLGDAGAGGDKNKRGKRGRLRASVLRNSSAIVELLNRDAKLR